MAAGTSRANLLWSLVFFCFCFAEIFHISLYPFLVLGFGDKGHLFALCSTLCPAQRGSLLMAGSYCRNADSWCDHAIVIFSLA